MTVKTDQTKPDAFMRFLGRRHWRKIGKILLITTAAGLVILGLLFWYTTTPGFQAMVRRRLVAQLERITGARAELGGFHVVPFRFRVQVDNLTLHGTEDPSEVPYVHVDRLIANMHIISILGRDFGFRSVIIDHPTIHVLLYPDGTTNQPGPKLGANSGKAAIEKLFSVSISYLEVRHGRFLWNDKDLPLDFAANDLSMDMTYSLLHRRYDSNILLGKIDTKFDGYRPFAWMAEAHFSLGPEGIEVRSARANSGRSHLEASGHLENFVSPKIDATYKASLDLAEIDAESRHTSIRHGVLEIAGQGLWSSQTYTSSGRLDLKGFEWRDADATVRDVALTSPFTLDPTRITLSKIQARALGGAISGDGEIFNWLPQGKNAKGPKSRLAEEQKGSLRLRFKDISVAQATNIVPPAKFPLSRMNLTGGATGSIDIRWSGSWRNAESIVALDVEPPSRPAPSQIAVKAHVRGIYRAKTDELEVAELTASTRGTQLHATGMLSSASSLKIAASTTDLNEWRPVLSAFHGSGRLPVTLHGHASFNGTAAGKISNITLAGNVQADNFDILAPATSHTPEHEMHWDTLAAGIGLSSRGFQVHNAALHSGHTEVDFELTAGLQNYHFTDSSPFTARLDTRRTEAEAAMALLGVHYPITGTLDFRFDASGTRASPRGEGHVLLTDANVYGEPVERLAANIKLVGTEVELDESVMAYRGARISGMAAYDFSSGASRFNLTGTNFQLVRIPQIQNHHVVLGGALEFTARGSGTLAQPVINATVRVKDLTLDGEDAGGYTFEAVTQGEQLRITGRSQFNEAELSIDGTAHLRDDWTSTIDFHFNHLDADSALRTYLKGNLTGHSAIAGDVRVQGALRHPRDLNVSGALSDVFLNVEDVNLRNEGPVRFSISRQELKFDDFHFLGERTDLTGNGTIQLTGQRRLDLHAHGRVNLRLIESFNHDVTSQGVVTVDASLAGTMASPIAQGRLEIRNGSISYADLPSGLSEMNGSLLFNQDRVQIENLTARSGGGMVTLGGFATLRNGHSTFDFTIHGEDVRVRYPPGVSSTANADLHFSGTSDGSMLSGDVTVTKLSLSPGFDFAAYLAHSAQSSTLPQTNPTLNRIRLDVHVMTTPELRMQTAIVRLSGDADLHLRGTAAKPAMLGRADVIEGEIYFNGAKYHLERGDVSFVSPVSITPVLDLQMSTRVRDYDITVSLNGEASKMKLSYRSEPPLPEADIVALLALGRTREESAQLQQSGQPFSQEASNAILSEALNATVSTRVQRLFGGSRVKIDPQGLNTETTPTRGPEVTIEQQVTKDLTLTYSTNVSQASQQIIQVEYNLSRNVSILGVRDQNGVVSIDVLIRRRKK